MKNLQFQHTPGSQPSRGSNSYGSTTHVYYQGYQVTRRNTHTESSDNGSMPSQGNFNPHHETVLPKVRRSNKISNYQSHTPIYWSENMESSSAASNYRTERKKQQRDSSRAMDPKSLVCRSRNNDGEVTPIYSGSERPESKGFNPKTRDSKRRKNNQSHESVVTVGYKANTSTVKKNAAPKNSEYQSPKVPMTKLIYNLEIIMPESQKGDYFHLDSLLKEALIVHNEISRRINNGANPSDIEVSTLREIYYFTPKGFLQHIKLHYLTDLQITYLLQEVQSLQAKLATSRGLNEAELRLSYLAKMRFLNFRRLGQTHWIDYSKKQIRLLGMPVALKVKGLEVLEQMPEIKAGGMRLIRKREGFGLSIQLFVPDSCMEEFRLQCIANCASLVNSEEYIENEELDIEQMEKIPDYKLIDALCEKYNRNKDLDKYDNSPHFLKDVAS